MNLYNNHNMFNGLKIKLAKEGELVYDAFSKAFFRLDSTNNCAVNKNNEMWCTEKIYNKIKEACSNFD